MQEKSRPTVIVALDVERARAVDLVKLLHPAIGEYKIGSRLFTSEGPPIIEEVRTLGASVFLDLKFHDIPATVEGSVRAAVAMGISMMTIHTTGGDEMMKAAARAAAEAAGRLGVERPLVIGVTVLTSLSKDDLALLFGARGAVKDMVLRLAGRAKEGGLDGVVASVEEARLIKAEFGSEFKVVTPGIRPAGADAGDQKRIATPRAARDAGADFLVVGRSIIEAAAPLEAARRILEELGDD